MKTVRAHSRLDTTTSFILVALCIAILAFAFGYSIGYSSGWDQERCDYQEDLYDGQECVSRMDHHSHEGTVAGEH